MKSFNHRHNIILLLGILGLAFSTVQNNIIPFHQERNTSNQAMWSLQFEYNVQDTLNGTSSLAGITYFNSEFWVSQWNTDSLFRLDSSGHLIERLTISTLSGVRGITHDGTNLWCSNTSTTIYKVNPVSKTVEKTLSVPSNARFLTYDETADNGNGGFWLGDWDSDIYLIDTLGNTLQTIPSSTHGLSGMYGAAIDNSSVGGPYLWIHWQGGSLSESEIIQLDIATGQPTGVGFDVTMAAGASDGRAGGMFISNEIVPNQRTIGGIIQKSPNTLFGLELDFEAINYDVNVVSLTQDGAFYQIPIGLATEDYLPSAFSTTFRNDGQQTVDVKIEIWLERDEIMIFQDSLMVANMTSQSQQTVSWSNFVLDSVGGYKVFAKAIVIGNIDDVPANNIQVDSFKITEAILSRDDGIVLPSPYALNLNASQNSKIGVLYEFTHDVQVEALEVELVTPTDGGFSYPMIYEYDSISELPSSLVVQSFTPSMTSDSQYLYTLTFDNTIALDAGAYVFAITQPQGMNLGLGQSEHIFKATSNFFSINGNWSKSNVATARMIRVKLKNAGFATPTTSISLLEKDIHVFPNPTSGQVEIRCNVDKYHEKYQPVTIQVFNNNGQLLKTELFQNIQNNTFSFDFSDLQNGVYYLRFQGDEMTFTKKVLKISK